jgi:hypothetical protein
MTRYVEIFWCPSHKKLDQHPWLETACQEPKHLYPLLLAERAGAKYLKCPAFSKNLQNTFVVTSPFDLTFTFDAEKRTVCTDRYGQTFYDDFVRDRAEETSTDNPILFSVALHYLFFSFDSVEMEQTDIPILNTASNNNIRIIPGKFNISKWLRPIDFAVEVIDPTKPVTLKAGDPIFCVTFTTKNNVPIKLTRVVDSEFFYKKAMACVSLKKMRPGLNLNECYEAAESFIGGIKRWLKK